VPGLNRDASEYDDGYTKKEGERACYSFCMCPGGQIGKLIVTVTFVNMHNTYIICINKCIYTCYYNIIVPTSVDPNELCVNGMSFSQRQSPFANAALVVSVEPEDVGIFSSKDDPLLGVAWQQEMERKAAIMCM